MTREQARALLKELKDEPTPGSTYMPVPICEWMVDAVMEAYDIGLRNGRLIARDWE